MGAFSFFLSLSRRAACRLAGAWLAVAAIGPACAGAASAVTVDFGSMPPGTAPAGFTLGLTGGGGPVAWTILEEPDAPGRRALAQTSADKTDYRFPLCLYDRLSLRDLEVSVRFKPVAGEVDRAAGIVVRAQDPDNYYVLRANALEDNVNLYKVVRGRRAEIKGARIKVPSGRWQTLALRLEGDRFEASLNGRSLFKATDQTLRQAGRVGLWTKADSVTAFAELRIQPLGP